MNNTKIVCLCGSTKFKKEFEEATLKESLNGNIVLSVCCFSHADAMKLTTEQKELFDELHKRKIEMADDILVVNPNGYIGESTQKEMFYANSLGKELRFTDENYYKKENK